MPERNECPETLGDKYPDWRTDERAFSAMWQEMMTIIKDRSERADEVLSPNNYQIEDLSS